MVVAMTMSMSMTVPMAVPMAVTVRLSKMEMFVFMMLRWVSIFSSSRRNDTYRGVRLMAMFT